MAGRVKKPRLIGVRSKNWLEVRGNWPKSRPGIGSPHVREVRNDLGGSPLQARDSVGGRNRLVTSAFHRRTHYGTTVGTRDDIPCWSIDGTPERGGVVRDHLAANRLDRNRSWQPGDSRTPCSGGEYDTLR